MGAPQNPVEIRDWRLPEEWPEGAKPVTRQIQYDDLYRVSRVDYAYSEGDDDWTSPFETELAAVEGTDDRRRAQPSPHVSFEHRTQWQTFAYDWLGNTASTRDDANGFYDRSLGAITNGGNAGKPYQIHAAQGASDPHRGGRLDATYDAAGNLTRLDVRREAEGANCLGGTSCAMRFAYQWDEVGRLVRARRWDLPANQVGDSGAELPGDNPAADLSYVYDAGDQRVLKTARDYVNDADSHTAYIFETLELRRAQWLADGDPAQHDYELSKWTEVPYLFANGVRLARVVWHEENDAADLPVPDAVPNGQYVLLELGDHLGSTSVVLDRATGELVERSTFYAYGATESDYRPDRWKGFREDYRFTGKEEDVEVGLTYFGKRYLNPLLGRWVSPDPLAVHVPAGENPPDLNLYAYVRGQVLKNVDPLGLQEDQQSDQAQQDQAVGQDWVSNPDIPADVTIGEPLHVRTDATSAQEADEQQAQDDRWTNYAHARAKDKEIAAASQRQAVDEAQKWEERRAAQDALPPAQRVLKAIADRYGLDFEAMQRSLEGTAMAVGGRGKGGLKPGPKTSPPRAGTPTTRYVPPPKNLPAFKGLKRARPKTPVQGGGGLRRRWKDAKGNIYEWDSQHGTVEKYNRRGQHVGEFDAETGKQVKPPNPKHEVEP